MRDNEYYQMRKVLDSLKSHFGDGGGAIDVMGGISAGADEATQYIP